MLEIHIYWCIKMLVFSIPKTLYLQSSGASVMVFAGILAFSSFCTQFQAEKLLGFKIFCWGQLASLAVK